MGLEDLLRPLSAEARHAARGVPVLARMLEALVPPPNPNRYVAPRLRALDGVALALRGYRVAWTDPTHECSSVLICLMERADGTEWWGVEAPTILPGEVHRVASWWKGARTIGWRFAWWQARREASWILRARAAARRDRRKRRRR